jgi:hypothetical protein
VSTFFDLCRKTDIIPTNETISLLDTLKATEAKNASLASATSNNKRAPLTIRQEFERGLRAQMAVDTNTLINNQSSNNLLDLLQIYILPEISTEQAITAYQRLGQFIKEYSNQIVSDSNNIINHQWWQLPILVGFAYTRDRPGFICVPFDLNYTGNVVMEIKKLSKNINQICLDFKQYLIEHGNDIREESVYRRSRQL